jgi:rhodanese-related sulfurtransferase
METIDRETLNRVLSQGSAMRVLNVLPEEAFAKEHIPGSSNIPLHQGNFTWKVEAAVGSKDRRIVVYCANNECSASKDAAHQLEKAGFTNVFAYEGGMKDWKEAGYPIEGAA